MIYAGILGLHIAAAFAAIGLVAYVLYVVVRGQASSYKNAALALGTLAGFEVATGTLLALLSPEVTAVALGLHIAVFLGACAVAELLLYMRMKQISLAFPLRAAASPALAAVCLYAAAVSYAL